MKSLLTLLTVMTLTGQAWAQTSTPERQAMEKLAFLTGNWAGQGISYGEGGSESPYYDTEDVWFDVQNSVLIIQARGFRDNQQFYGLHTIIYYDAAAGHYVYSPYSAKGLSRSFTCTLEAAELKCILPDGSYRLTFRRTDAGDWNEFGERLVDGAWVKNFETILGPAEAPKVR